MLHFESENKACPSGMRWQSSYRKRIGSQLGASDYMVRWDRGEFESCGTSHCKTLTEARREARALVKEGRRYAEIFRWAENGVMVRRVHIATYERG